MLFVQQTTKPFMNRIQQVAIKIKLFKVMKPGQLKRSLNILYVILAKTY